MKNATQEVVEQPEPLAEEAALASKPVFTFAQTNAVEMGSPAFWQRLANDPRLLAAQVCSIDAVNIELTCQQHAALRAWVNAAYEVARTEEMKAEFEQTRARARALLEAQKTLSAATGKPKTVDVMKAEMELTAEVIAADDAYLVAREKVAALKAMSNAGEDRLQMLVQLAARQRQEIRDANRN